MTLPPRTRPEDCLSDYRLDALRLGALATDARAAAETHLRECTRCGARLAELEADAATFATPKVRARAWMGVVATLALAACVVLWVRRAPPVEVAEGVRLKGGAHVELFVEHHGRVRRAGLDETVEPGDKLQFAAVSREPAYVAVVSIDGAGAHNVYYAGAQQVEPASQGEATPLPVSIVLDGVLGPERIWAFVCRTPQREGDLRERLARDGAAIATPPDCTRSELRITKIAGER